MDQRVDSNGSELYQIIQQYGAPDYVKQADAQELRGSDSLPVVAYADLVRRFFPLHTKAAVWSSFAFFMKHAGAYKKDDAELVATRILSAAKRMNILDDISVLKQAYTAKQPAGCEDLSDDDFAVIDVDERGNKQRHMPMRNSLETKRAAEFLAEHRYKLGYLQRRAIADRILQKAAEFGVNLQEHKDFITKQAGYGACTAKTAVNVIKERVTASCKVPGPFNKLQTEMAKLAEVFEKHPEQLHEPGIRVRLAENIENFDKAAGIYSLVVQGKLEPVEDALFGITGEKVAAIQQEHTSTVTGNVYRLSDIEQIKVAALDEVLGSDIAKALTIDGIHICGEKAAEVIPTLPRSEAAAFDQVMTQAGFIPVEKKAVSYEIAREYLLELAKQYQAN